jgi:hypothetical protein
MKQILKTFRIYVFVVYTYAFLESRTELVNYWVMHPVAHVSIYYIES